MKNQQSTSKEIRQFLMNNEEKIYVKNGEKWENFVSFWIGSEKVIILPAILLELSSYTCS